MSSTAPKDFKLEEVEVEKNDPCPFDFTQKKKKNKRKNKDQPKGNDEPSKIGIILDEQIKKLQNLKESVENLTKNQEINEKKLKELDEKEKALREKFDEDMRKIRETRAQYSSNIVQNIANIESLNIPENIKEELRLLLQKSGIKKEQNSWSSVIKGSSNSSKCEEVKSQKNKSPKIESKSPNAIQSQKVELNPKNCVEEIRKFVSAINEISKGDNYEEYLDQYINDILKNYDVSSELFLYFCVYKITNNVCTSIRYKENVENFGLFDLLSIIADTEVIRYKDNVHNHKTYVELFDSLNNQKGSHVVIYTYSNILYDTEKTYTTCHTSKIDAKIGQKAKILFPPKNHSSV